MADSERYFELTANARTGEMRFSGTEEALEILRAGIADAIEKGVTVLAMTNGKELIIRCEDVE